VACHYTAHSKRVQRSSRLPLALDGEVDHASATTIPLAPGGADDDRALNRKQAPHFSRAAVSST
jgi:hypothetical protein